MAIQKSRPTGRIGAATVAGLALILAACGNGGSDSNGSNGGEESSGGDQTFDYLAPNENQQIRNTLSLLGENECSAEEEAMPLQVETLPQADVNQRVRLLASQDALPDMFIAPTSAIRPDGSMADDVLDLGEALTELGVYDDLLPAAVSTVENVYGGFVSLPYQLNIEGFWYNTELFDELGIDVPQTWDEWVDAAETLEAADKTPFTVSGDQSWSILRYVGAYLYRDLGPDAMTRVIQGEAQLTDPEYLRGIEEISDLSRFIGPGVSTMDMDTAQSQLLTGEAGMMYNGSWMLSAIHDDELNVVGSENFGFFPFPEVEGGAGSIDQYPANAGAATSISASLYEENEELGDWLVCIVQNYGSTLMNDSGAISGFQLNEPVEDVPPLTAEINEILESVTETVLWFEAEMGERGAQAAGENAVPLITGSMSAEEFAQTVQAAIDADESDS